MKDNELFRNGKIQETIDGSDEMNGLGSIFVDESLENEKDEEITHSENEIEIDDACNQESVVWKELEGEETSKDIRFVTLSSSIRLDYQVRLGKHVGFLGLMKESCFWKMKKRLNWIDTGWVFNIECKSGEIAELKFVVELVDKNRVWDVGLQLGSVLKVSHLDWVKQTKAYKIIPNIKPKLMSVILSLLKMLFGIVIVCSSNQMVMQRCYVIDCIRSGEVDLLIVVKACAKGNMPGVCFGLRTKLVRLFGLRYSITQNPKLSRIKIRKVKNQDNVDFQLVKDDTFLHKIKVRKKVHSGDGEEYASVQGCYGLAPADTKQRNIDVMKMIVTIEDNYGNYSQEAWEELGIGYGLIYCGNSSTINQWPKLLKDGCQWSHDQIQVSMLRVMKHKNDSKDEWATRYHVEGNRQAELVVIMLLYFNKKQQLVLKRSKKCIMGASRQCRIVMMLLQLEVQEVTLWVWDPGPTIINGSKSSNIGCGWNTMIKGRC
ncbi:putative phosphoglucan, water dikinase [Helianthus anomalus]